MQQERATHHKRIAPRLILASASPRRLELLRDAGIACQAVPADVDETLLPGETPAAAVCRLAGLKAAAVAARFPEDIVLGADTLVVHAGAALGKPASMTDAAAMLERLSGHTHEVCTGVCLVRHRPAGRDCWLSRTTVSFRQLTAETVRRYLGLVNPLDKAGAYAIQEHGEMLIAGICGLRSNVIGLPVEEVVSRLALFPAAPVAGHGVG